MKKSTIIILHIVLWALFIVLNTYYCLSNEQLAEHYRIVQCFSIPVAVGVAFYAFYFYLAPALLLQKKYVQFIIYSIAAASAYTLVLFINYLISSGIEETFVHANSTILTGFSAFIFFGFFGITLRVLIVFIQKRRTESKLSY